MSHYVFRSIARELEAARPAQSGRPAQEIEAFREIEGRIDRALMTCQVMWTIMRDRFGITDEELIEKINEIDMSDGKLDGKVRRQPLSCPKCSRTVGPRFNRCMYCGQPLMPDPFV